MSTAAPLVAELSRLVRARTSRMGFAAASAGFGITALGYLEEDAEAACVADEALVCNSVIFSNGTPINDGKKDPFINTYPTCSSSGTWAGADESISLTVPNGTKAVVSAWDMSDTLDIALFVQEDDCAATSKCTGMSNVKSTDDNALYGIAKVQDYSSEERVKFTSDGSTYYATVDDPKYVGWNYNIQLGCHSVCAPSKDVTAEVTCSSDFASSTKTGSDVLNFYECGAPYADQLQPNPEAIYHFLPQKSGSVTFTLSGLTADQDLYVLEGACATDTCTAGSTKSSTGTESLTFNATQGKDYYIVVEAFSGPGDYNLSFKDGGGGCLEDCDDLIDNDKDGAIDCKDTDCATDPVCGCTKVDYFPDKDADGYGDGTKTATASCTPVTGQVANSTDCNDGDKLINPASKEVCNGVDDDCDGVKDDGVTNTYYQDVDKDTYGDPSKSTQACTAPAGHVTDKTDCADADSTTHPNATEICDLIDNDCDGVVDDNATGLGNWYKDGDGDKYGAGTVTQSCGSPGAGYVNNNGDCVDTNPAVNPAAFEICNGIDDDCDGLFDDQDLPTGASTWYQDLDVDAYGNSKVSKISCTQPAGYVLDKTDCNDAANSVHPGAAEIPYDGIDQDCLNGDLVDMDGDGYASTKAGGTDCNDRDVNTNIVAVETVDGRDQDCDGKVDDTTNVYDDDGDGYSEMGGDCEDLDPSVSPAKVETCNRADDDCDGTIDEGTECYDDDGDCACEVASPAACGGSVSGACSTRFGGDCNDGDKLVNAQTTEVTGNGVDDDCDGAADSGAFDPDGDGYTEDAGDCDNANGDAYPGAPEADDNVDNDCDFQIDEGTTGVDDDQDGASEDEGDCDDADPDVALNGTEVVDNGVDDDCDGVVDEGSTKVDDDGDGISEDGGDCDDANVDVSPGALEADNGSDDDCDGEIDEGLTDLDGDGFVGADDCDDQDGWTNPSVQEFCDQLDNNCNDDVDEGCDGTVDFEEPGKCGCATTPGSSAGLMGLLLGALLMGRRRAVR